MPFGAGDQVGIFDAVFEQCDSATVTTKRVWLRRLLRGGEVGGNVVPGRREILIWEAPVSKVGSDCIIQI